jgi:hypothetical protein
MTDYELADVLLAVGAPAPELPAPRAAEIDDEAA